MNKGCQKAPLQGKELRNSRKSRKVVAIYKTNKLHAFYKQFFYKQRQTKIGKKNQAKAKQNPEAGLFLFENYSLSSSMLPSKTNMRCSKKCAKNKCV